MWKTEGGGRWKAERLRWDKKWGGGELHQMGKPVKVGGPFNNKFPFW